MMTFRSELLASATKTVDGDRDKEFGDPLDNMKCAARLIGSYLGDRPGNSIEAAEIPILMSLFKIARLAGNRGSDDSWRDLAGYAAVGFDVQQRDQAKEERPAPKKRGRPRKVKG